MSQTQFESTSDSADATAESLNNVEPRIVWLKTIMSNMLGVFEPKYVNATISKNMPAVENFFQRRYETQNDLDFVVLFFWRTFYDKLIEEEITVLEEVPRPPPTVPDKKGKGKKKGDARMAGGKSAGKAGASAGAAGKGRKKAGQDAAAPAGGDQEAVEEVNTGGETTDAEVEGELEGEEEATVAGSGKSSARSRRKSELHNIWIFWVSSKLKKKEYLPYD